MSNYAIVNLMDLEVGGRTEVEARFARKELDSRELGISHFRYAPSYRSPFAHSHREQEEAYIVVAGSGRVLLDGKAQDVRQWDVVRVAPEVVRAFESGPEGLELIAVGTARPPDGDGVRGEANWPE
jgi:mannose-6-phosphate isomerase-like protein (cupin superfamily)